MQSRSETVAVAGAPVYPFLAQPPSHKKRTQDTVGETGTVSQTQQPRRRSLAAISDWASHVQPGPPAPLSPGSKAKFAESSQPPTSRSGRRFSVAPAPPSPVTYLPESPSGSSSGHITPKMPTQDKENLHAVGYTSVFVSLPRSAKEDQAIPATPTAAASEPKRGLNRFRTLSLKPRTKASGDASKEKSKTLPPPSTKEKKKAKYDQDRPALIATELALAQLMGGGSIEHHMRQSAEKEAKRNGAKKVDGQLVGVAPLHCDANGRVWRDQDEEWEYEHLLSAGAEREQGGDWVQFDERARRRRSESTSNSDDSRSAFTPSSRSSKSKHRPEPLNLAPIDPVDARRDFLQSSFAPQPVVPATAPLDVPSKRPTLLKSMFGGKKNRS